MVVFILFLVLSILGWLCYCCCGCKCTRKCCTCRKKNLEDDPYAHKEIYPYVGCGLLMCLVVLGTGIAGAATAGGVEKSYDTLACGGTRAFDLINTGDIANNWKGVLVFTQKMELFKDSI